MSNHQSGHDAERSAAEYLQKHGFKIRELNWKTRYCEIDIVAEKSKTIYFVEVKYRRTAKQGMGVDYILARKLRQMEFAAEMWVSQHDWTGDYRLAVISIDGDRISLFEEL